MQPFAFLSGWVVDLDGAKVIHIVIKKELTTIPATGDLHHHREIPAVNYKSYWHSHLAEQDFRTENYLYRDGKKWLITNSVHVWSFHASLCNGTLISGFYSWTKKIPIWGFTSLVHLILYFDNNKWQWIQLTIFRISNSERKIKQLTYKYLFLVEMHIFWNSNGIEKCWTKSSIVFALSRKGLFFSMEARQFGVLCSFLVNHLVHYKVWTIWNYQFDCIVLFWAIL